MIAPNPFPSPETDERADLIQRWAKLYTQTIENYALELCDLLGIEYGQDSMEEDVIWEFIVGDADWEQTKAAIQKLREAEL